MHPNQPSLDMNAYYFNCAPGSQASGTEYARTPQSSSQDSCVFSLQEPLSEYFATGSQESYPLLGHDSHETSSQMLQIAGANPAQPFHSSFGSGLIRASSPSSHPYQLVRPRHTTDLPSAHRRAWYQPPFPTTPAPASDTTSYNAVIGNRASARRHDPRQLPLVGSGSAPPATLGSASQSDIVAPNTNQIIPSFMVPGQAFLSTCETPASPLSADEADIEYAQYRYGNKRCFYQCRFDLSGSPCNKWIVGDRVRVLRHLRNHHHLQTGPAIPAVCRWDKCTHSRPMKQENLSRHVVNHLGVKWKCPHCRRLFSRDDAVHRHIERMVPGIHVPDAEVVPGCEARVINESRSKRARLA